MDCTSINSADKRSVVGKREQRPGQWTWIANAALDLIPAIGLTAFAVYCVLARHADSGTQSCWPSLRTLITAVGCQKKRVLQALKTLEDLRLIAIENRTKPNGATTTNLYTLLAIPPIDPVSNGNQGECQTRTTPSAKREPGGVSNENQYVEPEPVERSSIEPTSNNQEEQATACLSAKADIRDQVDPRLLELIDQWNALGPSIARPVRRDPPSKALLAVWKRCGKDRELREAFQDIPSLMVAIRNATFCHGKGWFTLMWIFTTDPHTKELRVQKILNGAYSNNGTNQKRQRVSADRFIHDPDQPLGEL